MASKTRTLPPGIDFAREYDVAAGIPAFSDILSSWHTQARIVRTRLAGQLDLAYGPTAAERLDFFPAAATTGSPPLLVFLHGGFWRRLDKDDFSWLAPPYVARGVSVAIVNYGLAPATLLEAIVDQCRRSIAWLYRQAEQLGFDRRRIVVAGHSAGGHLAGMALCTNWPAIAADLPEQPLAGGIVLSPLADLAPLARVPVYHADLDFTPQRIATLSPARLKPNGGAPVIGAVGGRESGEFKRQLALQATAWPDNWKATVDMPDDDHLGLCEAFANPATTLFQASLNLLTSTSASK